MKQTSRRLAGLSAEKKFVVILHSRLEFGRSDIRTMTRLRCDNESEIPGESSGMDGELTVPPSATSAGLPLRPWTKGDIVGQYADDKTGLHYTTATTTPSLALNDRNFGDVIAPASQQPQIIRAIARATGRTVTR
jgi:hypothetical protein